MHSVEAVLLKTSHVNFIKKAKLTPGWAFIRINFDTIQKIAKSKGGGVLFHKIIKYTTHVYCCRDDTYNVYCMQQLRTVCCFHIPCRWVRV